MNLNKSIAAFACAVCVSTAVAQEPNLSTPAKGFSYSLGLQTGENIRRQLPQAAGDIDLEAMMMGIRDRLRGEKDKLDVAEMTFWSGKFLEILEEREKAKNVDNLADGKSYREDYAKQVGVSATESGILYRELKPGTGRQPGIGQTVTMHYIGKRIDGRPFDNSRAKNTPHTLKVREMRAGLQEAVTLMQVGATWEVVVPPELAYGEEGVGEIGPNETLVYEIELLEIK